MITTPVALTSQAVELLNGVLLPAVLVVPLVVLVAALIGHRADDDARGEAAPRARPAVAAPPPAVLVVDDSAVVRARLRKLLEGAGYRVEVAADGREALAVLAGRRFAVLVTDLEMPTMDGFELIAAVGGMLETEDLPIVAITGHDDLHARVHALQGLYGLFRKPWNDRELLARIATLAALPRRPAAARATAAPVN